MAKPEWYLLPFDALLSFADGHLRDIDERTLRSSDRHLPDIVIFLQALLHILTRFITRHI